MIDLERFIIFGWGDPWRFEDLLVMICTNGSMQVSHGEKRN